MDYTRSYDSWGNTTSQVRCGITRTLKYDGLDHLVRWSSSVNSQEEWNLYDASGERVLRRMYDGTNTVLTVFTLETLQTHSRKRNNQNDKIQTLSTTPQRML